MSTSHKILAGWLAIATEKLCPAASERIQQEIRAHFEEAVAAHAAHGFSEAEAQTRALEDLGDARAAVRQFRKGHLTKSEARQLENTLTLLHTFRGLTGTAHFFGAYCSFIAIKCFMPASNAHTPVENSGPICSALSLAGWWLMPRRESCSLRFLLALDVTGWFCAMLPLLWYPGWTGAAVWIGGIILASVIGPLFGNMLGPIDEIRLLLKIHGVHDVWGEIALPPGKLREAIESQKSFRFDSQSR